MFVKIFYFLSWYLCVRALSQLFLNSKHFHCSHYFIRWISFDLSYSVTHSLVLLVVSFFGTAVLWLASVREFSDTYLFTAATAELTNDISSNIIIHECINSISIIWTVVGNVYVYIFYHCTDLHRSYSFIAWIPNFMQMSTQSAFMEFFVCSWCVCCRCGYCSCLWSERNLKFKQLAAISSRLESRCNKTRLAIRFNVNLSPNIAKFQRT